MSRRVSAIALGLAMLGPALAGGGAACCHRIARVAAMPACCRANATQATAPKGCCRAPVAKHEAAPKNTARLEAATTAPPVSPAHVVVLASPANALRRARVAHRAESPDESPPDVLLRTSTLLI